MTLPELAIFDMDGLIFDTERLFMEKRAVILREYGYEHREEDYYKTLGTCGEPLLRILHDIYGPDYPAEEISRKARQAVTEHIEACGSAVKPGITELLRYFAQKEVPCCVASSTRRAFVERYLRRAGLDGYFQYILGGDEIRRPKPDPEIFLTACEHFGTEPFRALVLEDSENGIRAAWNARIPVICIPDLVTPAPDLIRKTAGVVRTADEVISLFS